MTRIVRSIAAALLAATSLPVLAQALVDGEVRKLDKEQAKIMLKHAEIKALDMPPMTMVFAVKDRAMLDRVKVGDKVKFKAVQEAGRYTVTEIEVAR